MIMILLAQAPPVVVPVYTGGGSGPMPRYSELLLFAALVLAFVAGGVLFRGALLGLSLDDEQERRERRWFRAGFVVLALCVVSVLFAAAVDVFDVGPQPGDVRAPTEATR